MQAKTVDTVRSPRTERQHLFNAGPINDLVVRGFSVARRLTPGLCALATVGAVLPASAVAADGVYTQILCADPATGHGVGAPPEVSKQLAGAPLGLSFNCAGPADAATGIAQATGLPTHTDDGARAGVIYTAPPDVTILGASYYRAFRSPGNGAFYVVTQQGESPLAIYGQPPGESFYWYGTNGSDGTLVDRGSFASPFGLANGPVPIAHDGRQWHVAWGCDSAGHGGCDVAPGALEHRIFGGTVTLRDASHPQIAGTPSGALISDPVLRGAADVTLSATDTGSGVYRVMLLIDGTPRLAQVVDANAGACADVNRANSDPHEFARAAPCKLSTSGTYTFDTNRLPAGQHVLRLQLEDAAGNPTMFLTRSVTIEPIAESGDVYPAVVRRLNGHNAHPQAVISAHRVGSRRRVTTVPYGRRIGIAGRLRAPSGEPISGARVEVISQARRPGAPASPHGAIVTDAKGIFRYVAGRGPSRLIRFRYRAHLEDPQHVETRVLVRVIPKVLLRVRPRAARNRESVVFRGRIPGAPRASRPLVELRARKETGWTNFKTLRVVNGGFAYRYTFTRTTRRITYTIRARVRPVPGFPYQPGYSNRVRVHVTP